MKAYPGLKGGLVELEAVVEEAKKYIKDSQREISVYSIDLFSADTLPNNYDLHFYLNIFHIFSEYQCGMLADKSYAALPKGGKIVLGEVLLNDDMTGPLEACLFNMQMFKVLPHGRQFTAKEVTDILDRAGFHSVQVQHLFAGFSLIFGTK
jgi:acetylserotonin N-methyltransferase